MDAILSLAVTQLVSAIIHRSKTEPVGDGKIIHGVPHMLAILLYLRHFMINQQPKPFLRDGENFDGELVMALFLEVDNLIRFGIYLAFCGGTRHQRLDKESGLVVTVVAMVSSGWNLDALVMAKVPVLVESIPYCSKHANGKQNSRTTCKSTCKNARG